MYVTVSLGLKQYNNHGRSSPAFIAYQYTFAHNDTALKLHQSRISHPLPNRGCGVRLEAKMEASDYSTAVAWRGGFASLVVRLGAQMRCRRR